MRLRVALWMLVGAVLGLPVDELVESINRQLTVAKRSLNGKRLRMTINERLRHAQVCQRLGTTFENLFTWIISPDSLIRWLKRYQERKANDGKRVTTGRPWIQQAKVDAILKIYDAGLTGLSRIVGELAKCDITLTESTIRRVLTRNGRAPTDSNNRHGSTWKQFWCRFRKFWPPKFQKFWPVPAVRVVRASSPWTVGFPARRPGSAAHHVPPEDPSLG